MKSKSLALLKLRLYATGLFFVGCLFYSQAYGEKIEKIVLEGNLKVESDAIFNLLSSKEGEELDSSKISKDIIALYGLEYFADIRVYTDPGAQGAVLKVVLSEKPAITSIDFQGLKELKPDDFKEILETKLYTIVNEGKIAADLRKIENKYSEKGFFLANVTYTLEEKGQNEVALVFRIQESGKVLVGSVSILGNHYFTDIDIADKLASRPYTRGSAVSSSSLFQTEFVARDAEFLSYYYRDSGFADVKVAKPLVHMDSDQNFVRVTFFVEEGIQYQVQALKVTGDVGPDYYEEKFLLDLMQLKSEKLFRYSQFAKDIENLVDKYGDLGYAYVDVNPITKFDSEKKTVDITYEITKGQKIYFGQMAIIGNTKTRDNVIRREVEVADSELYSGSKLTKSKENISRLGYFEEVQVLKERDEKSEDLLNLKFKVKEKPTGQMQASLGFSPGGERKQSWFGQGRYDEKNQSGKGWNTNVTTKWASEKDYEFDVGFSDPKINDSAWSLGLNAAYKRLVRRYAAEIEVPELNKSVSISLGRHLFELVTGSTTFKHSQIKQLEEVYIFDDYETGGKKNSLSLALTRRSLDNYIDPSQGTYVSASHEFTGAWLGGDYRFMESLIDTNYYIPIDFSEGYRTYFKLRGVLGKLWTFGNVDIPPSERYRLGGYNNLRGFSYWELGPRQRRSRSPLNMGYDYNLGGDKQLYFQFEYFVPLIPKAGIKALLFTDLGRVFHEKESLAFSGFKKDAGFGFRWLTPIAPFRFEWAYPYIDEKKSFGDLQFIFTFGY